MKQIILILIVSTNLFSCQRKENKSDVLVLENGVEIPVTTCIETNKRLFGSSVNSPEFCKCVIPKIYSLVKNDPEQLKFLKDGNWDELSKFKQEQFMLNYNDCLSQNAINDPSARLNSTPRMIENMKAGLKMNLIGTDIEKSNDLDKYCNCVIDGLLKGFTPKEILGRNSDTSTKLEQLKSKCLGTTRKE